MATVVTGVLALILTVGTVVGVTSSLDSSTTDRVQPGSSAPVYGTP